MQERIRGREERERKQGEKDCATRLDSLTTSSTETRPRSRYERVTANGRGKGHLLRSPFRQCERVFGNRQRLFDFTDRQSCNFDQDSIVKQKVVRDSED